MLRINSKEINQGDTFLSLSKNLEEKEYNIKEAIDKGAACIITDSGEYEVKTIITSDTMTYLSNYLKELYYEKINNIKIIGIVGMQGKTSAQEIITNLLNNLGSKTSYIGTNGFYLDGKLNESKNDLYTIYEQIGKAIDNNCENIIIEISSDLIEERQLEGIKFDIIAFTNINKDTKSQQYINTLIEPFKMLKKDGYAIINKAEKIYEKLSLPNNHNIYYGTKDSEYRLNNITLTYDMSQFEINDIKFQIPLVASFNIYNFLIAYIIAKIYNYQDEVIIEKAKELTQAEGRYQSIKYKNSLIIIDYACEIERIKNVVKYTKEFNEGNIITIISCNGDTEKKERKKIGELIVNITDYVIFTTGNPKYEEVNRIIDDMTNEINTDNYEIIENRKEAIKKGINKLEEKDILLILGKGNEKYQIIGSDQFPMNDYNEVIKIIK